MHTDSARVNSLHRCYVRRQTYRPACRWTIICAVQRCRSGRAPTSEICPACTPGATVRLEVSFLTETTWCDEHHGRNVVHAARPVCTARWSAVEACTLSDLHTTGALTTIRVIFTSVRSCLRTTAVISANLHDIVLSAVSAGSHARRHELCGALSCGTSQRPHRLPRRRHTVSATA